MKIIFAFFVLLFSGRPVFSQLLDIIDESSSGVTGLTSAQLSRYEKIDSTAYYSSLIVFDLINPITSQADGEIKVNIDTCGDVFFRAKNVEYESVNAYMWYGDLQPSDSCSCQEGYLLLYNQEGTVSGQIRIEEATYDILNLTSNKYVLAKINNSITTAACMTTNGYNSAELAKNNLDYRDEPLCVVNVLILYTQKAEDASAAFPSIGHLANFCIAQSNQTLLNSAIKTNELRFRLAGRQKVSSINEANKTWNSLLAELPLNAEVLQKRSDVSADLVLLLVDHKAMNNIEGYAGLTFPGPDDEKPYGLAQVVGLQNWVFVHELGHLMGASHEPCVANPSGSNCCADDDPNALCIDTEDSYWHGHVFKYDPGCFKRERTRKTIMYSNPDDEVIYYFSNPSITLFSKSIGITDERDNARYLRENSCLVAGFNTDNENFIKANIAGDDKVCISSNATYTAQVFGPPGDYSYSWQISTDGVTYGNVLETSTIFYWSFQDIGDYYIRLTISVGSQTAYFYFIVTVFSFDDPFCDNQNRLHLIKELQSASLHQDVHYSNLRIYPNPVSQKLSVTLNKLPLQGKFIITNSIGQVLRDINLDDIEFISNVFEIDFSMYPGGVYWLHYYSEDKFESEVLIKK